MEDDQNWGPASDEAWEPYEVSASTDHTHVGVEKVLAIQGWETFLTVGSAGNIGVEIKTFQRPVGDGSPEYLLCVWGEQVGAPFVRVSTLLEAMRLVAQWAPIVQAASIARVTSDLLAGVIECEGMVESLAARVAWGTEERLPVLKDWDKAANERRTRAE